MTADGSRHYTGPLPTIGDTRREGMSTFSVTCARPNCLHAAYFEFGALSLPDDMTFVHIPKHRRFVCSRCAGREVTVMPDWRQHSAQGAPRRYPTRT
jgi:hypothetical protein